MPAVGQPLRAAVTATPWISRWTTAAGWTAATGTELTSSTVDVAPVIIPLPTFANPDAIIMSVGAFEAGAAAASPIQWRMVLYDRTLDVVVAGVQGGSADFPQNLVNDTDNVATVANDRDLRVHVPLFFDLRGLAVISPVNTKPEWFLCVTDMSIAEEAYLFTFRWLHARPL
jgi:hypothetical protein